MLAAAAAAAAAARLYTYLIYSKFGVRMYTSGLGLAPTDPLRRPPLVKYKPN